MNIAIQGCLHAELDSLYQTLLSLQSSHKISIDLLLICGDFQSVRDSKDLQNMACPLKYQKLGDFPRYFTGESQAPFPTIFIGGNHEASNYLQQLYYGGYVCPNIYYLGSSGVLRVKKGDFEFRLAGLSGIYNPKDFFQKHPTTLPLNGYTKRNVYHTKEKEILKLSLLEEHIDVFLSHDWPAGIENYGDLKALLKRKPFFKEDIDNKALGSPALTHLLETHHPNFWFAAHLHTKFPAVVKGKEGEETLFLALDKCLPHRDFLQIMRIEKGDKGGVQGVFLNGEMGGSVGVDKEEVRLYYDPEWMALQSLIDKWYEEKCQKERCFLYSGMNPYRMVENDWGKKFGVGELRERIRERKKSFGNMGERLRIKERERFVTDNGEINEQTKELLELLGISWENYLGVLYEKKMNALGEKFGKNNEEIDLDLDENEEREEEKKEAIIEKPTFSNICLDELPFIEKKR